MNPDNEAHQRDFYRIDVNNEDDPFILESEFEKIESPALASIKRIIQSNEMPVGENLNWIINFIGLLAARVPTIRKKWENFETDIYLKTLQMFTTSKASFNSVVSNLGKEGENIDVTFEEMKEFIDNERFKIDIPRNSSVERMLHSAAAIIDLLQHRKWSLIIADSNYEFITSDNPVVLKWIKNVKGFFGPRFGLSNTEVSLTISPKHMLLESTRIYKVFLK
ncbi:MAG: DUF4238 domain-containing protein [Deltaproteobacteria bacterium]|nr:DUF4238 domain-containing protein [Deltaproteobacteria bacterium]